MPPKILIATGAIIALPICHPANAASVTPIDAPGKIYKEPTMTMLIEAGNPATRTLMFIPGGTGRLGFTEGPREPSGPLAVGVFLPLAKKSTFNVVVVDNPFHINERTGKSDNDRLDRIETAIKFYKEKLNVPVILWGHSHGAGAVTDLINRSPETGKMLSGIVLSSKREGFDLKVDVKIPILFMHHKMDGCENTRHSSAVSDFERLKKAGFSQVTFATIEGGTNSGRPCFSGHHMFENAYEEALGVLEKHLPK